MKFAIDTVTKSNSKDKYVAYVKVYEDDGTTLIKNVCVEYVGEADLKETIRTKIAPAIEAEATLSAKKVLAATALSELETELAAAKEESK